ncbi:MAG: uroporphyrinogen-III synthase [Pseudohongiellaceae bacterium]|jgi:uroporphyrinogen-III synthase
MKKKFTGVHIALPESRQLDVLANLFEKRGATLLRCPLVSILDSPDSFIIEAWLKAFILSPPDLFIVLTGEGIKRLVGFAERAGILEAWSAALGGVYILARGPKPNRALKSLKLQANELAIEPTTDGIIKSLENKDLSQLKVSVQLYGEDPNEKLQYYLKSRGASFEVVAPYIYASDVDTEKVVELIQALASQQINIICFTSKAQYLRLELVAKHSGLSHLLKTGLLQTKIVAVGPVVADQLSANGYDIAAMPKEKYFMKPMVIAIEHLLL